MTVGEDILRLIEEHGGEFRAPEGNAGVLMAQELGHGYDNVSTNLYRMVKRGVLVKEGGPRRSFAYRLADRQPAAFGAETVDRIPPQESLIPAAEERSPLHEAGDGVDYDELAAALLRRVVSIETRQQETVGSLQSMREQLQATADELRQVKSENAQRRRRVSELEGALERERQQAREKDVMLQTLQNELTKKRRRGTPVKDLLPEDTVKELERMMTERPAMRGEGNGS